MITQQLHEYTCVLFRFFFLQREHIIEISYLFLWTKNALSLSLSLSDTLLAQKVKRWPTDLAVPGSSPAKAEIVSSSTGFH